MSTINEIIQNHAANQPNTPALLTLTAGTISYQQLNSHINQMTTLLLETASPEARVAIVLPGDEKAAIAFLTVINLGTAAPFNPKLTAEEFVTLFEYLRIDVVLTSSDTLFQPAVLAAEKCGLPCVFWETLASTPGNLKENKSNHLSGKNPALLLHTSGTTAKPKIVPLSMQNLLVSAYNISQTLQLTSADRCINVMPLFHIHGLAAALLASLYTGGSIICTPGYHGGTFFDWLTNFSPTWYTAVPTIHQAIAERIKNNPELIANHTLRFIRSSSSSLPPHTFQSLADYFKIPIVEAYGMTEAAHQIASNSIEPGSQKAGSVGRAAGPQIAIADPHKPVLQDNLLTGEIVIRGVNVITGYEGNPTANQQAFFDGWFRTGDEGVFDPDGTLQLTGRLKEMINRGGEKISPREIDDILLTCAGVKQAVCFAIPHPQYGEVVGAAIIRKGTELSEEEIRTFLQDKIADYKMPVLIRFVDEIPTGPTGKLQRIHLAKSLNVEDLFTSPTRGPGSADFSSDEILKMQLIWNRVFRQQNCPTDRSFLEIGGDSLMAAELILCINEAYPEKLTLQDLFLNNTIDLLLLKLKEMSKP